MPIKLHVYLLLVDGTAGVLFLLLCKDRFLTYTHPVDDMNVVDNIKLKQMASVVLQRLCRHYYWCFTLVSSVLSLFIFSRTF